MARWPWKRAAAEKTARAELEESLQEVRLLLQQAYAGFNAADDGELVESYIYEIQALRTRYSYLLRQRKALDALPAQTTARRLFRRPALPAV